MPNFDQFEQQLAETNATMGASETHGLLAGLMCSHEKNVTARVIDQLSLSTADNQKTYSECVVSLEELQQTLTDAIATPSGAFQPFLPEDAKPLPTRARAVRDWCQGFLYGLGLAMGDKKERLTGIAREATQDLAEITRMDLDDIGETEEEEHAIVEITEFLWVAAMLVYAELEPN